MYACFLCDKTVDRGNLVSHAKNRTKTLRKPNLHRAKIEVERASIRVMLCTKCLRRVRAGQKQAEAAETKVKEDKARGA